MTLFSQMLHFLVLVSAMTSLIVCEHFCQSFRDNEDAITSFAFYDNPLKEGENERQIIIDGKSWTFHYDVEKMNGKGLVNANQDNAAKVFVNEYIPAMVRTTEIQSGKFQDSPVWLFLRKDPRKVKFLEAVANPSVLSNFKPPADKTETLNVNDRLGSNIFAIFSEDIYYKPVTPRKSVLVFVGREGNKLSVNTFDISDDGMTLTKQTAPNPKVVTALRKYDAKPQVIGVFPKWRSNGEKYALVLLFKDEPLIRWCITLGEELDPNCGPNAEVLTNCSGFIKRPKTTPSAPPEGPTDEPANNTLLIIIIILVVVAVIIVIAVIIFFCCNKSAEEGEATSNISGVGPEAGLSKRSADVGSEKGVPKVVSGAGASKVASGAAKTPSQASKAGASGVKSTAK